MRQLAQVLQTPASALECRVLAGDAGSRRYYRVLGADKPCVLAVDTSAKQQRLFTALRAQFATCARVPAILAQGQRFLLLEDFGDMTYFAAGPGNSARRYQAAVDALVTIQRNRALAGALPRYDEKLLHREMSLFSNWYCRRYLARPLSRSAAREVRRSCHFLAEAMLAEPAVAVHRDYHSRNLMVCADGTAPGVLDFQDAVHGGALYDVVSLLRDAYIKRSAGWQEKWLDYYWRTARAGGVRLPAAYDDCRRQFNIAGAQRGLKVLGIFCRLAERDGKPRYLADLPLVYHYLLAACAAIPELAVLGDILADYPPP